MMRCDLCGTDEATVLLKLGEAWLCSACYRQSDPDHPPKPPPCPAPAPSLIRQILGR